MLFLKAHIANVALAGGVTGPPELPDTLLVVQTEAADTLQLGNSLGQPALNRARVHSVCGDNPSRVSLVCHVGIYEIFDAADAKCINTESNHSSRIIHTLTQT